MVAGGIVVRRGFSVVAGGIVVRRGFSVVAGGIVVEARWCACNMLAGN